ncbi:Rrf2 family transcriptional regulator [Cucumibacter marinus]|uniref:Rrf2 family transcriptional regulator n=1 Tax=Cucumibacter marinus TaxID=1121252 RepID=UPI000412E4B5|nr:Rrf2 family transcriptional regulator [Cucumibacter marinus]
MRLNVQTDFALRILIRLALTPERLVTIAQIADRFAISRNHLTKIAQRLSDLGFIETVRGRNGGLRLALPADEIRIGEVVRGMEPDFALVACMQGGPGGCLIAGCCDLRGVLDQALNGFVAILNDYTLADVTANRPELSRTLALSAE